jgi:serine/threonine protein kinase
LQNFLALGITSYEGLQQLGGSRIGFGSQNDFRSRKSTFLHKRAIDSEQHEVVGSPDYIAVEVMRGEGYTFAVDWWSVGVIIYEMIAGLPPFYAEEVSEVFQNILDYKNTLQFPTELDEDGNEIIEMTDEAWDLVKT